MGPRDTGTGDVLEQMAIPSLRRGGYQILKHQNVGKRLGDGKHIVDIVAWKEDGKRLLVSLKWQQVSGTAEQKIPFEMICLINAIQESKGLYDGAYIVMGGKGWHLRDAYVNGELSKYINGSSLVKLVELDDFVQLANQGKL